MSSVPHSPFTTRLSRSARETELRIRSIFQWKKQRPPTPLFLLLMALCLLSGGLVACQVQNVAPASGSPSSDSDTILQNKNENLPVLYDTETVSLDGLTLDKTGMSGPGHCQILPDGYPKTGRTDCSRGHSVEWTKGCMGISLSLLSKSAPSLSYS